MKRFVEWLHGCGLPLCLSISPRDRGGLPYVCDLRPNHWGEHQARVFGRVVRAWPWWGGPWW